MKPCAFAPVCRRRMRDGDHPDGCTALAQLDCTPDPAAHLAATIPHRFILLRRAIVRWENGGLKK